MIQARSQLRYTCGLSAAGYLMFVIAGPLAALGYDNAPEIYGIYTWPLIFGWLAGAAFLFSATFCFTKATIYHPRRRRAAEFVMAALWCAAIVSALLLFKAAGRHGAVNRWSGDAQLVGYGIRLGLAIVICTTLLPTLLTFFFYRNQSKALSLMFAGVALCLLLSTVVFIGLYACVWLDWSVGIDLYLSIDSGNVRAIERGLQWALLFSWVSSAVMAVTCVISFRKVGVPYDYQTTCATLND